MCRSNRTLKYYSGTSEQLKDTLRPAILSRLSSSRRSKNVLLPAMGNDNFGTLRTVLSREAVLYRRFHCSTGSKYTVEPPNKGTSHFVHYRDNFGTSFLERLSSSRRVLHQRQRDPGPSSEVPLYSYYVTGFSKRSHIEGCSQQGNIVLNQCSKLMSSDTHRVAMHAIIYKQVFIEQILYQ